MLICVLIAKILQKKKWENNSITIEIFQVSILNILSQWYLHCIYKMFVEIYNKCYLLYKVDPQNMYNNDYRQVENNVTSLQYQSVNPYVSWQTT